MPLVPALPPANVENRTLWGPETIASAQGVEGQKMEEEIKQVLRHWQDCCEATLSTPELESDSYRHVPFEDAGAIRVRYTRVETLSPRKFALDDDEQ